MGEAESPGGRPRAGRRRRWPWLAGLALLAVAVRAGVALVERLAPAPAAEAAPRKVEVIRLAPRPFALVVPVAGTLEPAHSVDVFPKVPGRVVAMHVGLGDPVKAGQPLATVEATEYRLMADKAARGAAAAEEAAEVARRELERLGQVRDKLGDKGVSDSDWDRARARVEGALAQARVARLDEDLARQMIRNATMTAPVDGVVSVVNARLGGMVGKEYPAFHVVDASSLVLRCEVGAADVARVAPGQAVTLRADTLPGREIPGEVRAVSPALDAWTRRAPVEVAVANPGGDIPGNLFVRGEIQVARLDDALVLPVEALRREGDRATVQVVRDGRVAEVAVTVRGSRGAEVAVEGLAAGDLVVLPGPAHLAEGEAVEAVVRRASGEAAGEGG